MNFFDECKQNDCYDCIFCQKDRKDKNGNVIYPGYASNICIVYEDSKPGDVMFNHAPCPNYVPFLKKEAYNNPEKGNSEDKTKR